MSKASSRTVSSPSAEPGGAANPVIVGDRLGTIAVSYPGTYDPQWDGERLLPQRVVIETVFGCNARCSMCLIDQPTDRPKGVMPMDLYTSIVDRLAPWAGQIRMFDLFGLGEPLLDPFLFERIRYARAKGFRRLAFATNGHLLTAEKQQALLDSRIDTVIFSLDGITRETLEAIRPRVSFDRVMTFCPEIVRKRNEGNYPTRFVVRFTRQRGNALEWEAFRDFWSQTLSPERGDVVYCYNVHNWSGQLTDPSLAEQVADRRPDIEQMPCHHAFEKLVILANGEVALCFEDILGAQFRLGNVREQDPIDAFNSPAFNKIRRLHVNGKKANLKICRDCRVLYSELEREVG